MTKNVAAGLSLFRNPVRQAVELQNRLPVRLRPPVSKLCFTSSAVPSPCKGKIIRKYFSSGLCRHKDVVMLLLPNMPEYAALFLGINRAGAVATTANPTYTPEELAKQAADSSTKLVITVSELLRKKPDYVAVALSPTVTVNVAAAVTVTVAVTFTLTLTPTVTVTVTVTVTLTTLTHTHTVLVHCHCYSHPLPSFPPLSLSPSIPPSLQPRHHSWPQTQQ